MDLKDIIKWFIPSFIIFLTKSKFKFWLPVISLFLFFNFSNGLQVLDPSVSELKSTKLSYKLSNNAKLLSYNDGSSVNNSVEDSGQARSMASSSRTFGRPFKKMAAAIIPLAFQIGAASTWAVVAAVVGVKTLLVALVILKLLLVAGAAKFGSLFLSHKSEHHQSGWSPQHQKEIHLHIHNSGHGAVEHSDWNRDGATAVSEPNPVAVDPYSAGPQTIHTPFGNYVKLTNR